MVLPSPLRKCDAAYQDDRYFLQSAQQEAGRFIQSCWPLMPPRSPPTPRRRQVGRPGTFEGLVQLGGGVRAQLEDVHPINISRPAWAKNRVPVIVGSRCRFPANMGTSMSKSTCVPPRIIAAKAPSNAMGASASRRGAARLESPAGVTPDAGGCDRSGRCRIPSPGGSARHTRR